MTMNACPHCLSMGFMPLNIIMTEKKESTRKSFLVTKNHVIYATKAQAGSFIVTNLIHNLSIFAS